MNHQITLVGGQVAPVYLGIKEFNPDVVHFLVTDKSKQSLVNLKPILTNTTCYEYICSPYDHENIKRHCEKIFSKLKIGDTVDFNVTGGTKVMLLTCQMFMYEKGLTGFYIDQSFNLLSLPDYKQRTLITTLSVQEFFALSGHRIAHTQVLKDFTESEFTAADKIELFSNEYKGYYKIIRNFIKKTYIMPQKEIQTEGNISLSKRIFLTWGNNKIEVFKNGNNILSVNGPAVHNLFFNAGWWELIVARQIGNWKKGHELLVNCQLPFRDIKMMKNEFDILVSDGKKIIFIECKSGDVKLEDITKMHAIRQVYGGVIGKSLLVSRFMPTLAVQERCKEMDIDIYWHIKGTLKNPLNRINIKLDTLSKKMSL